MQRFSLRAVLVFVAFLALVLAFVMLQARNSVLRREVEMLRAELGYLVPADVSKVNLIEVPTGEEYSWRWRVFAPPGTQFDAGIVTEEIPKSGAPSPSFLGVEIPSEQNGVLVTASITNDLDAGYVLKLDFGNGNVVRDGTLKSRDEFSDGSASLMTAGRNGPQVCDFNEPIILHRRRLHEQTSPTTYSEPKGKSRGMMFWITPTKKP
ncbi:hypothetical protein GCM10023156_39700 [Novipirellula rosea]|uniref:Uncharacterized protein n=2 Tax=Novipirellula rosea TaxID=1031540 RepID=A0ABP8N4G5_9BACT